MKEGGENMKKGVLNFVTVIFLGILLYYGALYEEHLRLLIAKNHSLYPYILFKGFFPIVFGILLVSPQIYNIVKGEGECKLDRYRLIFMGIPTLYASLLPVIYYLPISRYLPFGYLIQEYAIVSFGAGVALAYIIVTSIKRQCPQL